MWLLGLAFLGSNNLLMKSISSAFLPIKQVDMLIVIVRLIEVFGYKIRKALNKCSLCKHKLYTKLLYFIIGIMYGRGSLRTYASCHHYKHRRTGEHPFGGSNRVLPEWRKQLVCHAAPPGRKNNNELLQCLFLTVVDYTR